MANGRGTLTDTNGIAVVGEDLLDTQVTDDDVLLLLDETSTVLVWISFHQYQLNETYRPNPSRMALASFPMMLVLLPTFT